MKTITMAPKTMAKRTQKYEINFSATRVNFPSYRAIEVSLR